MPDTLVDDDFARWDVPAALDIGRVLAATRVIDFGTISVNGHGFLDPIFPFGGLGTSRFGKDIGGRAGGCMPRGQDGPRVAKRPGHGRVKQ